MTDIHEIAEYMRRMGEHEDSIRFQLGEIPPPRPSLLEMFGQALDPRGLTMERAVAVMNPPATETGD